MRLTDMALVLRSRAFLAATLLAPLLAACATTPAPVGNTPPPRADTVRQPRPTLPRDPSFQTIPGLEGVIGVSQKELVRQFGMPRLEVWEGDARKLQFVGKACVIDVFLYPTSATKDPVATWVDARRASDGQDVDRAACVAALRQK